jgi:hypothetical protein
MTPLRRIEFWPDYGGALLHDGERAVALEDLGLPEELVAAARRWVGAYDDAKLEPASREEAWIAEGKSLFDRLQRRLRDDQIELFDWEGYWHP